MRRLDALIRLSVETLLSSETMKEAEIARLLNSVGLTPSEIARILGKKSRTQVSGFLYGK